MATQVIASAVLVLNTKGTDAMRAGAVAGALSGVSAVTADPERGQVVVRYNPDQVASASIRESVRARQPDAGLGSFWIFALPKLMRALPAVASLV